VMKNPKFPIKFLEPKASSHVYNDPDRLDGLTSVAIPPSCIETYDAEGQSLRQRGRRNFDRLRGR
jgi:hypothetical protein